MQLARMEPDGLLFRDISHEERRKIDRWLRFEQFLLDIEIMSLEYWMNGIMPRRKAPESIYNKEVLETITAGKAW